MKKKNLLVALSASAMTCLVILFIQHPSFSVIQSWKQDVGIAYNSYDPYYLNVVEDNYDLGHLPFSLPRRYFIYIGKEGNEVTYGHVKDYSFEYNQDIDEYLKKCKVVWNKDGVTFNEPSGHKLFFPKKSFIGGR